MYSRLAGLGMSSCKQPRGAGRQCCLSSFGPKSQGKGARRFPDESVTKEALKRHPKPPLALLSAGGALAVLGAAGLLLLGYGHCLGYSCCTSAGVGVSVTCLAFHQAAEEVLLEEGIYSSFLQLQQQLCRELFGENGLFSSSIQSFLQLML